MAKRNFVLIRSFLAANVDTLLDNLGQRRNDKKIDSDDLFGSGGKKEIALNTNFPKFSKLDILLKEKESLGLYVSGNPLEDYAELAEWVRKISYRDDVYVVVINKIRKIFTKKGHMMFALELSSPDGSYEGIIFPKSAMELSVNLKEKDIFLVKGKLDQKEEQVATKVNEEGELQEFDELPKILIDSLVPFEFGIVKLLAKEEATLSSLTFQRNTDGLDWNKLKTDPHLLFESENLSSASVERPAGPELEIVKPVIKLTKKLGVSKIKEIKTMLKKTELPGHSPVIIEVESGGQLRRVKGNFWLEDTLIKQLTAQ